MKIDKKPIIGFICVMLSCILIMGITIGLLSSANNRVAGGTTADTAADNTANNPEVPTVDESVSKPELEWGFGSVSGCAILAGHLAYRSDTNTFDIEDVRLTICFGESFSSGIEREREYGKNVPKFDIVCFDNEDDKYLIREVNENYVSEKYETTDIYDEEYRLKEIIFNHSEEIVIPKEAFKGNKGAICLQISGMNVNVRKGMDPEYKVLAYTYINYEIFESSKVRLSPSYDMGKVLD